MKMNLQRNLNRKTHNQSVCCSNSFKFRDNDVFTKTLRSCPYSLRGKKLTGGECKSMSIERPGNSLEGGYPSSRKKCCVGQHEGVIATPGPCNLEQRECQNNNNQCIIIGNGGYVNHRVIKCNIASENSNTNSQMVRPMMVNSLKGNMSPRGNAEDNEQEHDCDDDKMMTDQALTGDCGQLPDGDTIKMFVGQIPKHMNESELKTFFEKYGRVYQINVLRDKVTKESKGCCFVTYFTRRAALDAQNALHNIKTLPGMNNAVQMKPADNENRYDRKLFIGMLSKKLAESDVRNIFSRFGTIDDCTVLRLPTGESRGCAFLTYSTKQSAQNAIQAVHHSTTMEGCSSPIVVKFADTPKDKDQRKQSQAVTLPVGLVSGFNTSQVNLMQPQGYSTLFHHQHMYQNPSETERLSSCDTIMGSDYAGLLSNTAYLSGLASLCGISTNQARSLSGLHSALPFEPTFSLPFSVTGAMSPSYEINARSTESTSGHNRYPSRGHTFQNSQLLSPKSSNESKQIEGPEGSNLFVYHLLPELGDSELAQMFAPFGTLLSAKVFMDKHTNLSKCFGFVSFDNPVSAQMAIHAMNGVHVGVKRLKVALKRPKHAGKPYLADDSLQESTPRANA